jgi:hypothetical protein
VYDVKRFQNKFFCPSGKGVSMILKPVKMREIVLGQRYLEMVVCLNGTMFLKHHLFLERPKKERDGWWIRVRRKKRWMSDNDDVCLNFICASSAGLVRDRKYGDNHHRTFLATQANKRTLAILVKRQALEKYCSLIGVKTPRKKLSISFLGFVDNDL